MVPNNFVGLLLTSTESASTSAFATSSAIPPTFTTTSA
jgi:hypothetical protein